MKTAYLSIRLTKELEKQIRAKAKIDQRTLVGEVLYLVTVGLLADNEVTRAKLHGGACQQA